MSAALPHEKQIELCTRARAGDVGARHALIVATIPFVWDRARRFCRDSSALEDLVQEGSIGIARAIEKFDATRGTNFITYAAWWIDFHIREAVAHVEGVDRSVKDRARRAYLAHQEGMDGGLSYDEAEEYAAEKEGMRLRTVRDLLSATRKPLSLDAPRFGDQPLSIVDTVPSGDPASDEVLSRERGWLRVRSEIARFRGDLTARQRIVFDERVLGERSLQEVGDSVRLSRERIRQIEEKLLRSLSAALKKIPETWELAGRQVPRSLRAA